MQKHYQKPQTSIIRMRHQQGLLEGSIQSSRESYNGLPEQFWD